MLSFRSRTLVVASALLAASLGSVAGTARTADLAAIQPQSCDDPDDSLTLFAERLGRNRIGYGLSPGTARVPGPTIELTEGDCIHVNLVNDTDRRLSLHPHGVDYTVASDGTPVNASCVRPGRSRTYVLSSHVPQTRADGTIDPGSAGYWHYHDHCMGTPHGTEGIESGLFGALIVRRAGDPVPDAGPFVLTMIGRTFNLKRAPRTPMPKVNMGQRAEIVVIGHGDLHHTFHLHGHRWLNNRTGLPVSVEDGTELIDNKNIGPADSFGFQIVAGEHVGPGAWMYHCHVQNHSDLGMNGLFIVRTSDGEINEQTQAAIERWRELERGLHH
jgi:FtsP/CotA-like multicopper oxidase with cupredoxin domain